MDGVQPELTFFLSEQKELIKVNLKQIVHRVYWGYTFTHRAIIQPLHKKRLLVLQCALKELFKDSLIKCAHGAYKQFFVLIGIFPVVAVYMHNTYA